MHLNINVFYSTPPPPNNSGFGIYNNKISTFIEPVYFTGRTCRVTAMEVERAPVLPARDNKLPLRP